MPADPRASRVWKRMLQIYGARFTESYGEKPTEPWIAAIDDLTDQQIAFGIRQVMRDTPIHPPTLGQFAKACNDMPVAQANKGPSLQEQLCAYVMVKHFRSPPLSPGPNDRQKQVAMPWTYLYREWIDPDRPKHLQRCAECVGVLIPAFGDQPEYRVMVIDMLADTENHQRAMRSFQPGPRLSERVLKMPDLRA